MASSPGYRPALPAAHTKKKMSFKEWLDIVQSFLTILAIFAAGWWFVMQGFTRPEVKLENLVTQRRSVTDKGYWLIAIEVKATNVGKIPVTLNDGGLLVTPVNPEAEPLDSKILKNIFLDPGESDQAIIRTLLLPEGYRTVVIQSQYRMPRTILGITLPAKATREWRTETLFDVGLPDAAEQKKP
jgi:hypothetical protein